MPNRGFLLTPSSTRPARPRLRSLSVGVAIFATFVFAAIFASAASAEGTLLAEWLWNGAAVTGSLSVEISISLTMEDTKTIGGAAGVLCLATIEGSVGANGVAEITEILNPKGEKIGTSLGGLALLGTGEGSECKTVKVCSEGSAASPIEITPLGLPWHGLLFKHETTGTFLLLLYNEGELGYESLCLILGITSEDKCTSSTKDLEIEVVNEVEGVVIPASAQTEPLFSCTQGGAASGKNSEDELTLIKPIAGGKLTVSSEGGGGGGAEPTTLSTTLSGEGKEGETITVLEGSKVKDKATLKGKNATSATGKVTYNAYSDSECKTLAKEAGEGTVSGESVTASSEEELEGGASYYWQAHYAGDSKNSASTSECTEISSVKAKTTLTTKLSGESKESEELTVLEGSKVKDTATLAGTRSSTAGGKVTYNIYSDGECKTSVEGAGEATVTSGSVPASSERELAGGKTYYWQAHYGGDGLHQESTSTCKEILDVKAKTTITTLLSGEGQESETIEVQPEAHVTDTATLHGVNVASATGTLSYALYSDAECKTLVAEAGSVSVSGSSAPASSAQALAAGTYYWQASYAGDALHQASSSTCGEEVLTVKPGTVLNTTLSGEGQTEQQIEVATGEEVTDSATLSGANASTATGTVTYAVYSDSECHELVTKAGEVTVTAGSVPDSSKETLTAGTYYWQATYSGDSTNQSSTSACGSEISVVQGKGWLTTSFSGETSSTSEVPQPFEVIEGTPIVDKATLHSEEPATASGIVTYDIYSDPECKELVTSAGEVTVTSGSIPAGEKTLPTGKYYWQANYSGDEHHHSVSSPCGSEVSVVKGSTSLTTSLDAEGHSGETVTVSEATDVADDATLSGSGTSTATGTVEYSVYSDNKCTTLVEAVGSVEVTGGVVPSSPLLNLPAGTYYWQAAYSGDAENAPSKSSCGSEIMTVKKMTQVSTELTSGTQSGDAVAVASEAGVTDQATLTGPGISSASGTVTYKVYSDSKCETLAKEAGTVTVTGGVAPTSSEIKLPAGTYYWQAAYSGDEENAPSTSECGVEIAVVTSTAVTTTLSGEEESAAIVEVFEEASVTDTARLASAHSASASGTVTYKVYSDSKCETLAKEAGTVTVTGGVAPTSSEIKLPAGTYYWQASYSGDTENAAGVSICGEGKDIVTTGPRPRLEQVNFLKNQPVAVDHPMNSKKILEAQKLISQWPVNGEGEVEWKTETRLAGVPKNWPVAYVMGEQVELEAQFAPDRITRRLSQLKELENAKIIATMKVFGSSLKAESRVFNKVELAAQISKGVIETEAIKTAVMPNKDGYESVTITWKWEVKFKGVTLIVELGKSTHNLYVVFKRPSIPPRFEQQENLYLTVLDIASQGTIGSPRALAENETQTVEGVWSGVSKLAGGPLTPPKTVVRIYEPANGAIKEGWTIRYWPEGIPNPVGKTLLETLFRGNINPGPSHYFAQINQRAGPGQLVDGSLVTGLGECNSWAELLSGAMGYEGIKTGVVAILPRRHEDFLVKHWSFASPAPGELNTSEEVVREEGAPAQGWKNPWAFFQNHVITLIENQLNGENEIYDASYATGPIAFRRVKQGEVTKAALLEYQQSNIAGFCSSSRIGFLCHTEPSLALAASVFPGS